MIDIFFFFIIYEVFFAKHEKNVENSDGKGELAKK
jgi:hypothetical protein